MGARPQVASIFRIILNLQVEMDNVEASVSYSNGCACDTELGDE